MDIAKEKLMINSNLLKGVFWLILIGITGQAIVPTYSKQFVNLIDNNDIVKHIIILWSIYFLIDFSDNKDAHPFNTFKQSVMIWIGYLVVSKQPLYFNIFNFLIISTIYIVNSYDDYQKQNIKDNNKYLRKKHTLLFISNSLSILLIISCLIGLYSFYKKEKTYKKKEFKNAKFIFGSNI